MIDGQQEMQFQIGTIARCNRCDEKFELPKLCHGIRENSTCYRLQQFCTSPVCGHMDTHWVIMADNA